MNEYNSNTYSLFVNPSFRRGIARLWDFRGRLNMYNTSKSTLEADAKAIRSDWLAVGQDLHSAMKESVSESVKQYESKICY